MPWLCTHSEWLSATKIRPSFFHRIAELPQLRRRCALGTAERSLLRLVPARSCTTSRSIEKYGFDIATMSLAPQGMWRFAVGVVEGSGNWLDEGTGMVSLF